MGDDQDSNRIREAVAAMLPTTVRPWTIDARRHSETGAWIVLVEHEASRGFGFEPGRADAATTIEEMRRMIPLRSKELDRVAAAPALAHPDEVMEIRTLAHIFNWSRLEVKSVVRLIERWSLSPEEGEWLMEWVGHDEGPPSPSRDF